EPATRAGRLAVFVLVALIASNWPYEDSARQGWPKKRNELDKDTGTRGPSQMQCFRSIVFFTTALSVVVVCSTNCRNDNPPRKRIRTHHRERARVNALRDRGRPKRRGRSRVEGQSSSWAFLGPYSGIQTTDRDWQRR